MEEGKGNGVRVLAASGNDGLIGGALINLKDLAEHQLAAGVTVPRANVEVKNRSKSNAPVLVGAAGMEIAELNAGDGQLFEDVIPAELWVVVSHKPSDDSGATTPTPNAGPYVASPTKDGNGYYAYVEVSWNGRMIAW